MYQNNYSDLQGIPRQVWSSSSPPWLSPSPRSSLCHVKPVSPLWQMWKCTADSNTTITWLFLCPDWGWLLHSGSEICAADCVPLSLALALHVCVCTHTLQQCPPFVCALGKPPAAMMRDFSETKNGTFWVFPYSSRIRIFDTAITITIRNKRERTVSISLQYQIWRHSGRFSLM